VTHAWSTLSGAPTQVIAHRGASGALPEHTLAAYRLALEQGADVLEPDLVISADAQLLVRHDRGLRRSTDVALQPAFAGRDHDGDWWVDAFAREELRALRSIQPFPQRDAAQDGLHPILDFDELLAWAGSEARRRGVALRLYPEIKLPATFLAAGRDAVGAFIAAVRDVDPRSIVLQVQCFEIEPLRRIRDALGLPVFLLLEHDADWREALHRHGDWLSGVGAAKTLLHGPGGGGTGLVHEAHRQGLEVHAWTYRDDVLPFGVERVEDELVQAFALGVDAVFCDFPATALACRRAWAQA
jgi:glycerophosphoryl diester phosphodiesterase